jgi:hypothetical protein
MENDFLNFFYIYLLLEKFIKYKKYILVNDKFNLIFRKVFFFNKKYFLEVMKNLKISYYLLIISNLVLKLLITIYFILNCFTILSIRI